jgi:hypothetical protein
MTKDMQGWNNSKEKGCVKVIVQSQSMKTVVTLYPGYNGSRATRKLSMRSSKLADLSMNLKMCLELRNANW